MALPSYNASLITAVAQIQQGASFPKFIIGGQGGSGGTTYQLMKKGTSYGFHLFRGPVHSFDGKFRVTRISLRFGATMASNMSIIPVLYFDNESSSQVGTTLNSTNYPSQTFVVLNESNFSNNCEGQNNVFLELQVTGSVLFPIELPIEMEVEVYDNPFD